MPTKTKPTTVTAASPAAAQPTKSALVLKLLTRTKGATIVEMAEPTGWQPHSTRAYLSGLRKQGRSVIREQRKTGETAYRIVPALVQVNVVDSVVADQGIAPPLPKADDTVDAATA